MHAQVTRLLLNVITHFSFATIEISRNFRQVKTAIQTTHQVYDIVIKRLHLYYDMRLVTFGVDENKNLIVSLKVNLVVSKEIIYLFIK